MPCPPVYPPVIKGQLSKISKLTHYREKIIFDHDLAKLYGVSTKSLNQAVKRNSKRFPNDFMFQLTKEEKREVVTNCDHLSNLLFSPTLPHAFTEHGTIMLANVLNSPRAADVSVLVVRAFVRLRTTLSSHQEITQKITELEQRVTDHDMHIRSIVDFIRQLMGPAEPKKNQIGFHWDAERETARKPRKKPAKLMK